MAVSACSPGLDTRRAVRGGLSSRPTRDARNTRLLHSSRDFCRSQRMTDFISVPILRGVQSSAQSQADLGAKLASLQARIVKERKILEGFQAMRNATSNQDVIRTCDAKIREAQRTIGWFEDSVRELENRRAHLAAGRSASPASNSTGSSHTLVNDSARANNKDLPNPPPGAAPSYVQPQAYGAGGVHGRTEAVDAASVGGPGGSAVFGGQKAKEQFTNLGKSCYLGFAETDWNADRSPLLLQT